MHVRTRPCELYIRYPSLLRLLRLRRQYVGDVLRVFPRESNVPKRSSKSNGQRIPNFDSTHFYAKQGRSRRQKIGDVWYYSLSMAPPRHKLFLLVREADGSVGECLADWIHRRELASALLGHCMGSTRPCCFEHSKKKQKYKKDRTCTYIYRT